MAAPDYVDQLMSLQPGDIASVKSPFGFGPEVSMTVTSREAKGHNTTLCFKSDLLGAKLFEAKVVINPKGAKWIISA